MQIVNNISICCYSTLTSTSAEGLWPSNLCEKKNYSATNILLNLHHFIKEISSEYSNTRDTLDTSLPISIILHVSSNAKLPNLKHRSFKTLGSSGQTLESVSHSTLIYPGQISPNPLLLVSQNYARMSRGSRVILSENKKRKKIATMILTFSFSSESPFVSRHPFPSTPKKSLLVVVDLYSPIISLSSYLARV